MIRKVYNLIILDESGSMAGLQQATISSFNELVQFIAGEARTKPEREQWIQFFSFNGNGIREQVPLQRVTEMQALTDKTYRPDNMTPLFDAIGHATGKLRYALEKENDYIVLVTILTDGAENSSKEFTATTISNIVKELEQQQWVFTYMGTNQDVKKEATRMSIRNFRKFENDSASLDKVMLNERDSRRMFYQKLDEGQVPDPDLPFFGEENED